MMRSGFRVLRRFTSPPIVQQARRASVALSGAVQLRVGAKINWVFWRSEDKAAKEGEAGILFICRCSLTLAAVAAARQNAEVIFEWALSM